VSNRKGVAHIKMKLYSEPFQTHLIKALSDKCTIQIH